MRLKGIIILAMIITISICCNTQITSIASNTNRKIKIGVLLNNYYNPYNLSIKKSLEDVQKENGDNVQFVFFNGEGNPAKEIEIINNMINGNYDLLVLGILEEEQPKLTEEIIDNAREKNIPIIFFNINSAISKFIKSYPKAVSINTDSVQAGTLQGEMIIDAWNTYRKSIDKNDNNIMEYVLLKGQPTSFVTAERTQQVTEVLNKAGIKTKELTEVSANWNPDIAENVIKQVFFKYANNIEGIISNNDSMAIGAIRALQKYGYNLEDKSKTILVFGIGGVPEAQELIKKGEMYGSVAQDTKKVADVIYAVGMNLILGMEPLEGTNYKFDKTGVIILVPYEGYITQNKVSNIKSAEPT